MTWCVGRGEGAIVPMTNDDPAIRGGMTASGVAGAMAAPGTMAAGDGDDVAGGGVLIPPSATRYAARISTATANPCT